MNVQRRILSLAAIAFLLAAGSSAQQTKTVVPAKLAVATEDQDAAAHGALFPSRSPA